MDFDQAAALIAPEYRAEWPDAEFDLGGSFAREVVMMTGLPDTAFRIDTALSTDDGRVWSRPTVTGVPYTRVLELPHGVVLQPWCAVSLQFVLLMRFAGAGWCMSGCSSITTS